MSTGWNGDEYEWSKKKKRREELYVLLFVLGFALLATAIIISFEL